MVPEQKKPQVTEIQVRMDCKGCVQKIKKALHGINGIYDLYIDFPQQKLTIIGWADPEKIVKAIRNARRIATICSHTVPTEPAAQPVEQATEGGAPPAPVSDLANPPRPEAPQAEKAPPTEPPKDPALPPENPPPQEKSLPSPVTAEANASQPEQPSGPKNVGEVRVTYHHPSDYGYRYSYAHTSSAQWNRYHNNPAFPPEPPQPIYMTQSYNTYRSSPHVTGYEYIHSPPQPSFYGRMDYHNENSHENFNGNITSMFSDENPNACTIV